MLCWELGGTPYSLFFLFLAGLVTNTPPLYTPCSIAATGYSILSANSLI